LLAAVVDIKRWLGDDRVTAYSERLDRDREIGRSLPAGSDTQRVLAWWSALSASSGTGERLERQRRLATAALFALGAAVGIGAAVVTFGYSGEHPVNLLALLGVLVGVPLSLLILTVLLLVGSVPGLSTLREAFAGLSPGRWVGAWLARVSGVELFAAFPGGRATSRFARWQLVVFSQWFAVGFFVGVLLMMWLLVAFTDLAFGWSTTLQIESQDIYVWFSALAIPWSAWLPAAVPDLALVEASRFFRLEEGAMPTSRVIELGRWWQFVMMSIVSYGLLPRLALLVVGAWRLGSATAALLREDSEVTALLDRLSTPRVSYAGEAEPEEATGAAPLPALDRLSRDEATAVIIWNEAAPAARIERFFADRLGIAPDQSLALSVLQGADEQHHMLQKIKPSVRRLIIVTKGWEPPLLDFSDFLVTLRDTVGRDVTFVIAPLDISGSAVRSDHRDVWARALASQRDPRLYVLDADRQVKRA
jgi:hypothetical protein